MAQYKGAASEAGRAMQIMKRRERELEEMEQKKRKLEESLKINKIENKFAVHYDAVEQQLKSSTIGLVTLNEMKAKQEDVVKEREKELARKQKEQEKLMKKEIEAKQAKKKEQRDKIAKLSFCPDDEEEEEDEEDEDEAERKKEEEQRIEARKMEESKKGFRMVKNPDVDTSFLPDREREDAENRLREELRQEWVAQQEAMKNEEIEITFSYWDGSGHRRSVRMKKGNSVYQFLQRGLEILRKEFNELRTVSADHLMYIKEDLIIPHHYTFYDFIVNKARGKSGPLFHFDVRDDVRLVSDASVEKEESHAGKVVMRSWYERNKHIFPASRWEPYDPQKNYEKYTIKDKNKKK
ncbi:protein FAM50 homolog [Penaeus vannamei]|uniref:protein FAM50 homolog n=1 Tax=Penaeus vannamei TaxID=6689 RepID=UPI000F68A982|nr:protein FAM50 homolog [Penaeus vannamei]XP_027219521.1 protein FAM50 homolog [Penaeus vannamei]XP_027219523.1 protein FAM50 homolog [Penaeus vannamei]